MASPCVPVSRVHWPDAPFGTFLRTIHAVARGPCAAAGLTRRLFSQLAGPGRRQRRCRRGSPPNGRSPTHIRGLSTPKRRPARHCSRHCQGECATHTVETRREPPAGSGLLFPEPGEATHGRNRRGLTQRCTTFLPDLVPHSLQIHSSDRWVPAAETGSMQSQVK
jgi:hypothetical protein